MSTADCSKIRQVHGLWAQALEADMERMEESIRWSWECTACCAVNRWEWAQYDIDGADFKSLQLECDNCGFTAVAKTDSVKFGLARMEPLQAERCASLDIRTADDKPLEESWEEDDFARLADSWQEERAAMAGRIKDLSSDLVDMTNARDSWKAAHDCAMRGNQQLLDELHAERAKLGDPHCVHFDRITGEGPYILLPGGLPTSDGKVMAYRGGFHGATKHCVAEQAHVRVFPQTMRRVSTASLERDALRRKKSEAFQRSLLHAAVLSLGSIAALSAAIYTGWL